MRKSVVIWGTLGTAATTVTAAVLLSGGADDEKQVESDALSQENGPTDDFQIILDTSSSEPAPTQDQNIEANPVVTTEQKEPETIDPNPPTSEAPKQKEQVPPNKSNQNLSSPSPQSKEMPPVQDNPPPPPKLPEAPQPKAKPTSANAPTPKSPAPAPGTDNRPNNVISTPKLRTLTGQPPIIVRSGSRNYRPAHYVPNHALISLLNTRKVSSDKGQEGNPPALKITKAACGDAFFPKLAVQLPEQYVKESQNRTLNVLKNFSLGDSPNPVGCKIIKFSKAKQNAGFGYLSETVVKNGNSGFAMYVASTNAQHREHTVFDIWFLLLNRSGEDWNVTRSYRWHKINRIMDYGSGTGVMKQTPFNHKTPDDVWLKWSNEDPGYSKEAFDKLFAENVSDFERWDKDNYYVGVWFGGQKGSDAKQNKHIFHDGSAERWALMYWLGTLQRQPHKLNFLQTVKLTQEGKWVSVKDQCSELKNKYYFEMNTNELSTCIKSATSSLSP